IERFSICHLDSPPLPKQRDVNCMAWATRYVVDSQCLRRLQRNRPPWFADDNVVCVTQSIASDRQAQPAYSFSFDLTMESSTCIPICRLLVANKKSPSARLIAIVLGKVSPSSAL